MLALIGALTLLVLILAIALDRFSPIVALIIIPTLAALIAGCGLETAKFMIAGVTAIGPVAAMFVFAILFFGVMSDAGLMDPLLRGVLRAVGRNPVKIAVGTALLALLVHLDGSGAVCFLVVIPAMAPLYDATGMDRRVLACLASLAAGVNFLPWTGPTLRAGAALHLAPADIFRPMIGVQAVGLIFVFAVAVFLGRSQMGRAALAGPAPAAEVGLAGEPGGLRRPGRFWANLLLTLAVLATIISGAVAPAVVFMVATALALVINYPNPAQQRARLEAHAGAALTMASVLLAAGVFSGIMTGSGMTSALAHVAVAHVPHGGGSHIPFALALVSMPLSFLFDPDSFYFGVLPVLAQMHHALGGQPVQVAQAALVGQMTTGFPVSPLTPATFLVAGLSQVELGAHQRFTAPWLFGASLLMTAACVAMGLFAI